MQLWCLGLLRKLAIFLLFINTGFESFAPTLQSWDSVAVFWSFHPHNGVPAKQIQRRDSTFNSVRPFNDSCSLLMGTYILINSNITTHKCCRLVSLVNTPRGKDVITFKDKSLQNAIIYSWLKMLDLVFPFPVKSLQRNDFSLTGFQEGSYTTVEKYNWKLSVVKLKPITARENQLLQEKTAPSRSRRKYMWTSNESE